MGSEGGREAACLPSIRHLNVGALVVARLDDVRARHAWRGARGRARSAERTSDGGGSACGRVAAASEAIATRSHGGDHREWCGGWGGLWMPLSRVLWLAAGVLLLTEGTLETLIMQTVQFRAYDLVRIIILRRGCHPHSLPRAPLLLLGPLNQFPSSKTSRMPPSGAARSRQRCG